MAFGAEYVGMSDREILIDQAGDMKALRGEVKALAINVSGIHCPSAKCADHEERLEKQEARIAEQERIESERKAKTIGRRELLLWGIALVAGSGIGSGIILKLMGG